MNVWGLEYLLVLFMFAALINQCVRETDTDSNIPWSLLLY